MAERNTNWPETKSAPAEGHEVMKAWIIPWVRMSAGPRAGVDGREDPGAGTGNSPQLTFPARAPALQRVLRQLLYVTARVPFARVELLHSDLRGR